MMLLKLTHFLKQDIITKHETTNQRNQKNAAISWYYH